MHDAVIVDVLQRIQNARRDLDGALRRQLLLLVQDLPQQPAVHPLHDHVNLAAVIVGEDLHHAGMVHVLADLLLALEAVVQKRIALHFRDEES